MNLAHRYLCASTAWTRTVETAILPCVSVARVLRPGGVFAGFDAVPGLAFRLLHAFDTMVVIDPSSLPRRLADAGFTDITVDVRSRGFRFRARRPSHGHGSPVPQNGAS